MKFFITGISSGIGRTLTEYLIRSGHQVWGLARRKEILDELKKSLGDNFIVSVCNIADESEMRKVYDEMRQADFMPDVVILNAGVKIDDNKNSISLNNINNSIAVNVTGALFWVTEFFPEFLKRGKGTFIAISSTSALRPSKGSISYPLTKSALDMAFRGFRLNYPETKVKFTTIRLGPIETEMWEGRKNFLVATPEDTAKFIYSTLDKKPDTYYFPFLSATIFKILSILPDSIFGALSNIIKK